MRSGEKKTKMFDNGYTPSSLRSAMSTADTRPSGDEGSSPILAVDLIIETIPYSMFQLMWSAICLGNWPFSSETLQDSKIRRQSSLEVGKTRSFWMILMIHRLQNGILIRHTSRTTDIQSQSSVIAIFAFGNCRFRFTNLKVWAAAISNLV